MKTRLWKLLTSMIVLTMLVTGMAGCAQPTAEPTEAPVVEPPKEPAEEPTEAPPEAEPVTLRVGATTIWDAISPALGWENYT
ncbi:MAG: hypothetical protein KAT23_04755, partial [Anaerolineales bacterium]|nr:hypothetical protein [Anaerolineales bacterium]